MNFEKNISAIEKTIAYTFNDKSLLKQAFTRTSFCNEQSAKENYQSNEVLEFFGDSVLSCAIITLLLKGQTEKYRHGIKTQLNEGDFSNIKSRLSDKKNLSESTAALGLQKYLLMGEGDSKLGIENEPSVMEDLFESIIGAVYIDCGEDMKTVLGVVSKMLDVNRYLKAKEAPLQSFKNALQEYCADKKRRLPPPVYKTVSESGPEHKKLFERACYVGEELMGTGVGKNCKIADSAAAESALNALIERAKEKEEKRLDPKLVIDKLKSIAKTNKAPGPEFKDLGETAASRETKKEFAVECRMMGKCATATGTGKKEAKERAAELLLKAFLPEKKKAQDTPCKAKNSKRKFSQGKPCRKPTVKLAKKSAAPTRVKK